MSDDVRRDRRLPDGVTIRLIEGERGQVYNEVRIGDHIYRVPGQAQPRVEMEGFFKKKVSSINGHPVTDFECRRVRRVRRGFNIVSKCGDCGQRDLKFLAGLLTGSAMALAKKGNLRP